MNLIGMAINHAVTKGMYDSFDHAERIAPSILQKTKIAAGELGRKSGKGLDKYTSCMAANTRQKLLII